MATVTLELPDGVFSALRRSPDEFAREMRLAAAIFWYQQGEISHEMAALVAGLDRTDFIDALAQERVAAFHVDPDELTEELERGLQAHRERIAADLPEQGRAAGSAARAGG